MADFTSVNGCAYSSQSVQVRVAHLLLELLEISYSNKGERGELKPIGSDAATEYTRARRTNSASMKMSRRVFEQLTDYLTPLSKGDGYMNVPFVISVHASEPGRPDLDDVIEVAGINSDEQSFSGDSTDPLAVTCEMTPKSVILNKKKATR